ncbi:fasciclin domain-containing protein [Acidomonas methanolica]|uniref:fasciclin domain-containing protein n=1 Tax=Acidomonas methanolica TaxID=437 RepID=UPI00211A1C94|nr:fasciclin domain-containing protein [Acidomonas methanolica]MCQ9155997.1 fasciclin domain-containing protein [Acidomonas methanolica]
MMRRGGRAGRSFGGVAGALAVALALAGCESSARQDPLFVRGASAAVIMPSMAGRADQAELNAAANAGIVSSPVAYEEPPTPSYADRPLSENIVASLELADYAHALEQAGLMRLLRRAGPYTVFAIPNQPLEKLSHQASDGLRGTVGQARLRRILAYTIVPGRWDNAALTRKMARSHSSSLSLKTVDGVPLTVRWDAPGKQFVLVSPSGRTNRLWLAGAAQSNGVLYFTQDVLTPDGPA